MSDMDSMMPELTLNAEAAQVEAPRLTLSMEPEAPAAPAAVSGSIVVTDTVAVCIGIKAAASGIIANTVLVFVYKILRLQGTVRWCKGVGSSN